VGDNFGDNVIWTEASVFRNNFVEGQGGALHLQGGSTSLNSTIITGNHARQRGGGVAFENICGSRSLACNLRLGDGTVVEGNSAEAGGGVFLATPENRGVDIREIEGRAPADRNRAVYSAGVSVAPSMLNVSNRYFTVPSSTGDNGRIGVRAHVGQPQVKVAVEFCDFSHNDVAYLTGATMALNSCRIGRHLAWQHVPSPSLHQYSLVRLH
jgi:hypothetical protein